MRRVTKKAAPKRPYVVRTFYHSQGGEILAVDSDLLTQQQAEKLRDEMLGHGSSAIFAIVARAGDIERTHRDEYWWQKLNWVDRDKLKSEGIVSQADFNELINARVVRFPHQMEDE